MSPIHSDQWLEDAMERIESLTSLKESVKVAAGYLTDIWDELAVRRNQQDLLGSYDDMIDEELRKADLGLLEEGNERAALWELGRSILMMADDADSLTDPKFRSETREMFKTSVDHFRSQFPADAEIEDMIRCIFCLVIARQHSWFQAEVC
jgi:hypothetical protein